MIWGRDNIKEEEGGGAGKEREGEKDPDAACSPRPLDPPVTTTTFPSSEKTFLKSFSSVWAIASASGIMRGRVPGAGAVYGCIYITMKWKELYKGIGISAARFDYGFGLV